VDQLNYILNQSTVHYRCMCCQFLCFESNFVCIY